MACLLHRGSRELAELNKEFAGSEHFMTFAKAPEEADWTHIFFSYALTIEDAKVLAKNLIPQELSTQVTEGMRF